VSVDPVVEELAAVLYEERFGLPWRNAEEPIDPETWRSLARAVLADAGLRERIGAWEPPPDVAEMAAEALRSAFIDEWGGCNGGAPGAILMALRTMTTNGWTLTPPSEGGQ
jgi:hypothetical protein